MAASFYSIEEVMEKLQKSEDQIRDMVSEGKLREFRDGSKRLFKVNEVDSLASDSGSGDDSDQQQEGMDMSGELDIMAGSGDLDLSGIDMDELSLELDDSEEGKGGGSEGELNLADTDTSSGDSSQADKDQGDSEDEEEIKLSEDEDQSSDEDEDQPSDEDEDEEISLEPDEDEDEEDGQGQDEQDDKEPEPATVSASDIGIEDTAEDIGIAEDEDSEGEKDGEQQEEQAEKKQQGEDQSEDEISDSDDELPDLGSLAGTSELNLGELTKADTSVGTTGINVLGDTDDEYKLSDDSIGETKIEDAEIEGDEDDSDDVGNLDDDLNMDSVGSGSGLLDLSLQADDTSLGAVLDDILPGDEEAGANAAAEAADDMAAMAEPSLDQSEDTGPPEQMFEQEAAADVNAPVVGSSAVVRHSGPAVIEPGSNAFGVALLISLIVMVVGSLVLFAGLQGAFPGFIKAVSSQMGPMGMYWYIILGLMLLAVIISGMGWMAGPSSGTKKPKSAKAKKEKKPKKQKKKKK